MNLLQFKSAVEVLRLVPRRLLLACSLAIAGLTLLEGAGLVLLVPLLVLVGVDSGSGRTEGLVGAVDSLFAVAGLVPSLGSVLALYIAIMACQTSLQRWHGLAATRINLGVADSLRRRLYLAVSRVRWEFFARQRGSNFLHALTEESSRAGGAAYAAFDLGLATAVAAVYFAAALYMSPTVTVLVVVFALILGIFARRKFERAKALGLQISGAGAALYAAVAEHLAGMKTVKAYGAERRQLLVLNRHFAETHDVRLNAAGEYALFRQVMALGSTLGLAIVVYLAFTALSVPAADLLVLLFVFARLMPRVTGLYEKAQMLAVDLAAFQSVTNLEEACRTAEEPAPLVQTDVRLEQSLRMDNVSFSYDRAAIAVSDLNLVIPAGSTTAFVGPSGAGKSTIADLLLGLLTPDRGDIIIDGQPLTADVQASWRGQIGYVPQDTLLFHSTIRENLLWGCPEAGDEEIEEALRLASADVFVKGLTGGLNTVVGDRGVLLSGGERQRLSLARALLRRPRLLILDEATSSLDSENEARIQEAIDLLHARMTIVIITHRLSTIRRADMIHVVDEGRIVESGTWHDLLARGSGRFCDLCRAQGIEVGLAGSQAQFATAI